MKEIYWINRIFRSWSLIFPRHKFKVVLLRSLFQMMTWSRSIWIGILVLGCVRAVPQHQAEEDLPRDHGNSIEDKIGLPIYTTLNGSITNLNEINSKIHLNRTKAFLNCSQGSMQVELMFMEAFYGIAYADFDRNSACMTKGRGQMMAKIELPLKGM